MRKTSKWYAEQIRDVAKIDNPDRIRAHRRSSTLRKTELKQLAERFDVDVDEGDTAADIRAKILVAAGLAGSGTTGVDSPGSFTKMEKIRLLKTLRDD